jgi:hypothetical protein
MRKVLLTVGKFYGSLMLKSGCQQDSLVLLINLYKIQCTGSGMSFRVADFKSGILDPHRGAPLVFGSERERETAKI